MLSISKKNSNIVLKTLLCVFSILFLTGCASAWEQSFEGSDYDLPTTQFTGLSLTAYEHGYVHSFNSGTSWHYLNVSQPFTGYLGYSVRATGGTPEIALRLDYANGTKYFMHSSSTVVGAADSWHRVEFKKQASGLGIDMYVDGLYVRSDNFIDVGANGAKICIMCVQSASRITYFDDITTSSSHAIVSMDKSCSVTDAGQYYRLGVPYLASGKYYQVRLYTPTDQRTMTANFTNTTLLTEQLIPVANLTTVGEYTLHLYRVDSASSMVFLNMKSFDVTDPATTGAGSLTIDEEDYEPGDTVKVWAHINEYEEGYKIKCEFPVAGGSNFKKEIDVTDDTFVGSFTIPDLTNVIGVHTVYLLDPDGAVVDSEDFNVFVAGLSDIAFDKASYERTETANIYYKNIAAGSNINLIFRYGGTTSQTLDYPVSGSGVISLNLSTLAASDSVLATVKDSMGYKLDQDNAKIIVGAYELTGRVYNAKTGSVVPGATVTVQGNSIVTDSSGNYNISALAGFANYSVAATGYNGISGTVAVFDLKTIHNFYMSPVLTNAGTGVYGTVVSSKTDYPLVGASVVVTNTDNLKRFSTIVDNKGYYSVSNDNLAGNISIIVSYKNYDSIETTALITASSMQNHNFRLNAVTGYNEIDPSEHSGGNDDGSGETAEEKAYKEKYGEMGQHPFDFNGDGEVENSEWKYAGERFVILIGLMAFMGFLLIVGRRR